MNRILVYFALVCPFVLWGLTGLNATRAQQAKQVVAPQEVLLITAARPVPLDLQVQMEGETSSAWDLYLDKLFAFLDIDNDGSLIAKELLCAPAADQLAELTQNSDIISASPAPTMEEMAGNATGPVSREKFKAYYQREGLGALTFEAGRRTGADALTEPLWKHLDTNNDGKLSRAELRSADRLLRTLDQNEDDIVALNEILGREPGNDFLFETPIRLQDALSKGALVLRQGSKPVQISPGLMQRLDRDKSGKLTRAEVGLDRAVFERFDTDHDDEWSGAELQKWLETRPEARFELQLAKEKAATSIRFIPDKEMATALRWDDAGRRLIVSERVLAEFYQGTALASNPNFLKDRYNREFQTLDANKNGKLERGEVFKPPFSWVAILRLLDRDNDDTLTRKELDAWLEVQQLAVTSVMTVTMADRGATLFELLDRDRDGRLCPRELLTAWDVLKPWDRDGDNVIAKEEIPHQYHISVTRGQWRAPNSQLVSPHYGPAQRAREFKGPMWFRKMDRNNDGDISPREFVGNREAFRKLDRNNDGLIDAQEAEQANK